MTGNEDPEGRWPHQRLGGALGRGVAASLGLGPVFVLVGVHEPAAVVHLFIVAVIVASAAFLTEHRGRAGFEVWARLAIAGAVGAVLAFGATLWLQHLGDPLGAWREIVKRPEQLFTGALSGAVLGTMTILALGPWFHARACTVRLGPQLAGGLCVSGLVVTPWLTLGEARPLAALDLLAALGSGVLVPLFVALSEAPGRLVARLDPKATSPLAEVDPRPAMVVSLAPLVLMLLVAPVSVGPAESRSPRQGDDAYGIFLHVRETHRYPSDPGRLERACEAALRQNGYLVRIVESPDGARWLAAVDRADGGASLIGDDRATIVTLARPIALDVIGCELPADDGR